MRILATLPLAALLLAGCTMYDQGYGPDSGWGPPPQDDYDQGAPPPGYDNPGYDQNDGAYTALVTEPFWSLRIDDREMRYDPADGRVVTVPVPRPSRTFNGLRYVTPRLSVTTASVECSDGMSDRTYAETVTVQVEGRTLRGCGGAFLSGDEGAPPPNDGADLSDRLDGNWRVARIGGRPASTATIAFADGRISGRACNRFSGPYRIDRDRLVPGAIVATRMACEGPRMTEETALLRALSGPLAIGERDRDRLVPIAADGTRIGLEAE